MAAGSAGSSKSAETGRQADVQPRGWPAGKAGQGRVDFGFERPPRSLPPEEERGAEGGRAATSLTVSPTLQQPHFYLF